MSESGEQWSPNTPPPATAAKHATTKVVSCPSVYANASGRAIGMQIANVPQDEPVAKAMMQATRKIIAGRTEGVRKSLQDEMIKFAVPIVLESAFTEYASARSVTAGTPLLMPTVTVSMISLKGIP